MYDQTSLAFLEESATQSSLFSTGTKLPHDFIPCYVSLNEKQPIH